MSQKKLSYNFMLFGRTGAGKSSTGNTLLDRKCFKSSISLKSCTDQPVLDSKEFDDYVFNIVDTPGVCDMTKSTEEILNNFHEGMSRIPEGFNALLFVMKLGERCTKELLETIEIIKASFGEKKINDVCIFAMTNGEDGEEFNINNEEIQQWLKNKENVEENSEFATFLQECDYRAVVFYNKTADKRAESVKKLLSYLDPQAPRYTNEHFQNCAATRDAIVTRLNYPAQIAVIQQKLSLIKADIDDTLNENKERNLAKISGKIDNLLETLDTASESTDSKDNIKTEINDWKSKMENLPEDETERAKVIRDVAMRVDSLKVAGATTTTFGVITGGLSTGAGYCTVAKLVGLTIGITSTTLLGAVAVGLVTFGICLLVKSSASSGNKDEDKKKLL